MSSTLGGSLMNQLRKPRRARFAAAGAAALAVGLLASMGGVGYAASILGVSSSEPVAAQYPPVTITVSERAVPAHLAHGDTIGACPTQAVAPTSKVAIRAAKKAGKPGHSSHQRKTKKSHPGGQEHSALRNTLKGNGHAQGNGKDQATGQGQASGLAGTKSHGQGKDHANGHAAGHGQGQGGTHGQGNGQGPGNGDPGGGK